MKTQQNGRNIAFTTNGWDNANAIHMIRAECCARVRHDAPHLCASRNLEMLFEFNQTLWNKLSYENMCKCDARDRRPETRILGFGKDEERMRCADEEANEQNNANVDLRCRRLVPCRQWWRLPRRRPRVHAMPNANDWHTLGMAFPHPTLVETNMHRTRLHVSAAGMSSKEHKRWPESWKTTCPGHMCTCWRRAASSMSGPFARRASETCTAPLDAAAGTPAAGRRRVPPLVARGRGRVGAS